MSISHHSGKVKMSLCLIWYLAMKAGGGTDTCTPDTRQGNWSDRHSEKQFVFSTET